MEDGGDGRGYIPTERIGTIIPATDKDPWKDVAKKVAAGDIMFEPVAAQTAAEECADAIGAIMGLQKMIGDADNLDALSQLPSGALLATQFNNTLRGLDRVLGSHKTVLSNMMGTFVAAGKQYIDNELDSAGGFSESTRKRMKEDLDGVKAPTKPTDFSKKMPKKGEIPKAENQDRDGEVSPFGGRDYITTANSKIDDSFTHARPDNLIRPAVFKDGMADFLGENQTQPESLAQWRLETGASPENPDAQSWRALYDLGQSTGKVIKPVNLAGQVWTSMADEMDKAVGRFAERLTRMPESLWHGEGRSAAVGAVKDYHKKADDLSARMKSFGANLDYTSKWLANTKKGMPTEPTPPKPEVVSYASDPLALPGGGGDYVESTSLNNSQAERDLAIHRQNMENNYVQGIQDSSLYIPAFNDLPTTAGEKPSGGPKTDDTKTGGQGGGDSGTSGGTGPGYTGGTGPGYTGGTGPGYTGGGVDPTQTRSAGPNAIDPADYDLPDSNRVDTTDSSSQNQSQNPTDSSTNGSGPSGMDGLSQAAGLAQQGLGGAQSAAQQAAQMAQAAQQAAALRSNTPKPGDIPRPGAPGGLGGGPKGGGIGGGGSSPAAPTIRPETETARLFPRASLAGPAATSMARMGMPGAGMPMGGTPGTPGAGSGAGNQGQQEKEHKRPTYLNSKEHMEEALGEARTVTRAVVEQ